MIIKINSCSLWGINALPVEIEVDVGKGFPQFTIVGLPDQAVKESKERVRSAIINSGYNFPPTKIIVNLAPADLKKEGPVFDLPIAIGILTGLKHIDPKTLSQFFFIGELALTGQIRPVKGVIPSALMIHEKFSKALIIPEDNAKEASLLYSQPILLAKDLNQVVAHFNQKDSLSSVQEEVTTIPLNSYELDFADVKGQKHAKRALEVGVAGGHNILLSGPPGSGKSMLAKRIPGILPPMSQSEKLEIAKIYSAISYQGKEQILQLENIHRPFRSPHHSISAAGLVGGGTYPKPGEMSLAHQGVLFLDEFPEFKKDVIETLRAPLEDRQITITRARMLTTLPASFTLIAAMNPCRCGYLTDTHHACQCSLSDIMKYRNKISGPLMDRFDLQIEVPTISYKELSDETLEESSKKIQERVIAAREIQSERFNDYPILVNAEMNEKMLKKYCTPSSPGKKLLEMAINEFHFSSRAYSRILKVSRTIADLDQVETLSENHIAEAIGYRCLDRQLIS